MAWNWAKILASAAICILAEFFLGPRLALASTLPVELTPTRLEFAAYPGEHITGTVYFWNGTDGELPVHIEAEDIRQGDEEGHVVREGEDRVNALKSWVKPAIPEVSVFPKQKIALEFAIDIPVNADPGSHWGGLAVVTQPNTTEGGTATQLRIGAILLVDVYGEGNERLSLEGVSAPGFLQAPPVVIEARFKNEGTVHEKPEGVVEIRNMFGRVVASAALPERNVLPGTVRKIEVSVGHGVWFGRHTAMVRAVYGTSDAPILATVRFWVVPWKTYGPWALVTALFMWFIWRRRSRLPAVWHILKTGMPPPRKPEAKN